MIQSYVCQLAEIDGTPLTTARCQSNPAFRTQPLLMSVLDRPGYVVKRCLLDRVRDIQIRFEDGMVLRGQIERVYYDAQHGRVCSVQIESVAPAALPALTTPTPSLQSLVA